MKNSTADKENGGFLSDHQKEIFDVFSGKKSLFNEISIFAT